MSQGKRKKMETEELASQVLVLPADNKKLDIRLKRNARGFFIQFAESVGNYKGQTTRFDHSACEQLAATLLKFNARAEEILDAEALALARAEGPNAPADPEPTPEPPPATSTDSTAQAEEATSAAQ